VAGVYNSAVSTTVHELRSLIQSYHSLIVIESLEEERVEALLGEVARDLRIGHFEWSAVTGLARVPRGAPMVNTTEPLAVLNQLSDLGVDAIFHLKDFVPHLSNAVVVRALRERVRQFTEQPSTILLSGENLELPRELDHSAARLRLELPASGELRSVIRSVIQTIQTRRPVVVDLKGEEVQQIVRSLSGLTAQQARQIVANAVMEDGRLTVADVDRIIRAKGKIIESSGLLEFYPLEDNRFDLGGFERLKAWLSRAAVGFSEEARSLNLPSPRGVLFVGVQGCGKSLAAKYIAREWKLPLLKLDASRLYDKYVGESEKNFRRATSMAEAMSPVVLWIDEIEKAFAQSSSTESDGGLSRRLFGSFLTWMQEKRDEVFVVGTANDLSALPPELLRKGRFDEIFFVDLPDTDERRTILDIHLRLRKQQPESIDASRVVEATRGFSGAEIEQLVIATLYRSLHGKEPLTTESLLESVEATVPLSVTRAEDIRALRELASTRFVPVR
jgi:hypothetical protein